MAVQQTWMRCELREPVRIATFSGNLFSADNHANLIGVVVTDGGQAAQLEGSVYASVIRSDGKTVVVTGGHIDGNRAWITLPRAAYAVPGLIFTAIRIADGNRVTTIAAFTAVVTQAETGEAVDPGTLIPSIGDLISQIHEAVESIPEDYETALTELRQTDTDLEGEILRNKTELAALAIDLESLGTHLDHTDEALDDFITGRFEPLEETVGSFDGQVLAVQTEIAGLAADVERVERAHGDVGQLIDKVETLSEDLQGKADINELAGLAVDVEHNSTRIDNSAEAVEQATREAEQAQNEIAGAYAEVELVDSRLRYGWNRHASRFAGKTVSIIGDSIETFDQTGYKIPGYAMFYPIPIIGVSRVEDTWWKRVIDATGAKLGVNAAYSGSRATNTLSGAPSFYARTSLLGAADLIIVALGTNDSGANVPLGDYDFTTAYTELSEATFRTAYIKGIKALKARYPTAEIICVAKIMADGYRQSIAYIAQTLGCTYIDAGDYESINGAANPHPRAYGMRQIASRVLYPTDSGLTQQHMPADAQAVGQALAEIRAAIAALGGS